MGLSLLILGYSAWHAQQTQVKDIEIALPGLTEQLTAVQFTDIHLGHFRKKKYLQKIVNQVQQLKPDLIFIT